MYDSTVDAKEHRKNIMNVWGVVTNELFHRIINHDLSKLKEPERSGYDKMIPQLRETKFGTPEYYKVKEEFNKVVAHHYAVNRHHPEHFEHGYEDMNLLDFLEHIMDCYAASLTSDTPFTEGIKSVLEKNGAPDVLVKMVMNTYDDIFSNILE